MDDAGDVAFVKHSTVFGKEQENLQIPSRQWAPPPCTPSHGQWSHISILYSPFIVTWVSTCAELGTYGVYNWTPGALSILQTPRHGDPSSWSVLPQQGIGGTSG